MFFTAKLIVANLAAKYYNNFVAEGIYSMNRRRIIVCSLLCGLIAAGCICTAFLSKKEEEKAPVSQKISKKNINAEPVKSSEKIVKKVRKQSIQEKEVIKTNLYSDNQLLPLSAIAEISAMPKELREKVGSYAENSNLYYLKPLNNGVFLITGNTGEEKYPRHDIQFVEINADGQEKISPIDGHISDSDGEWEFDEQSGLPLKHIKHNQSGEVEYTEVWNYEPDAEIKYEMKNGRGNTLSLKKETTDGENNIRVEHLIYDSAGNTKINVSASYEGPDIKRFTYYNAEKPDEGVTFINEYSDGLKTKEDVYTSDYKLKDTYRAEYKDGERVNIKTEKEDDSVE